MPLVNGFRYYPSTAVFLNEVIKLSVCLTMALYDIATSSKTHDTSSAAALFLELARAVFTCDSWKLAIPAMLYTLQNSLRYVAISNLDAATFQVTNQLKILSTALFSVLLLNRKLDGRKWLSLLLLTVGVAIIYLPSATGQSPVLSIKDLRRSLSFSRTRSTIDPADAVSGQLLKRSASYEGIDEDFAAANPELYRSFGFSILAIACFISGLSSVYFEKILKESRNDFGTSVWIRNVQLSVWSLFPALFIGVVFNDGEHIAKDGFFAGYNWAVWAAILLQATGGILVAFVVKFADNIAKNFASSISILLSFFASVFFFDFEITSFVSYGTLPRGLTANFPQFVIGTAVVLSAAYLYNMPAQPSRPDPPQIRIPEEEKARNEGSYFDLESVPAPVKSPLRSEAISTSRPNTPTVERIPHKLKSPELRMAKRDQ